MRSRRRLLRSLGTVATTPLLGTTTASANASGDCGRPLDKQFQQIERATKRYREIDQALREGYQMMGPYVPAMGWHLLNPRNAKRAAETGPTLTNPSLLTYNLNSELGSLEYAVPLSQDKPDLFNDENADRTLQVSEADAWHPHKSAQHVFSNHNGQYDDGQPSRRALLTEKNWIELSDHHDQFPDTQPELEAGDVLEIDRNDDGETEEWGIVDQLITHPSLHTLHVWVHYDNPHGVFGGYNPDFDRFDPPGDGHDHEH